MGGFKSILNMPFNLQHALGLPCLCPKVTLMSCRVAFMLLRPRRDRDVYVRCVGNGAGGGLVQSLAHIGIALCG